MSDSTAVLSAAAPSGPDDLRELTGRLLQAARLDEAADCALRGLAAAPGDRPLQRMRAQALLGMGDPVAALPLFQSAAADPDDEEAKLGVTRARIMVAMAQLARTPGAPPGLAVRGPFRDTSGYSYMVRRYLGFWLDAGVNVLLAGKNWGPELDPAQRDPRFDALERPVAADTAVHFDLPSEVLPVPGLRNFNMTMTECSRVPVEWVTRARWCSRLILPTESSRQAWLAAGMPAERIFLCPLGCDPAERHAATPPAAMATPSGRPVADFRIRVAAVTSATRRKNLDSMVRAWAKATRPGDDAVLILKLGKDGETQDVGGYFEQLLQSNGLQRGDMAEIVVVIDKLSDAEIIGIYKAATHYWSMSLGEGWDLPMAQAGALGLTLLTPRHSAYLGYLNDDVAHFIPTKAEPAPWETKDPTEWWRPDEEFAADLLRRCIDGGAAEKSARAHLSAHFTWEAGARRLLEICRAP